MKKRIYLAGSIRRELLDGKLSDAVEWRKEFAKLLSKHGYEAISPMRKKLKRLGTSSEVVTRDLMDISKSDALIALIKKDTSSVGTPMEIFYASYIRGIPVIIICEEKIASDKLKDRNEILANKEKISPWYRYLATSIVENIEEAIEVLDWFFGVDKN